MVALHHILARRLASPGRLLSRFEINSRGWRHDLAGRGRVLAAKSFAITVMRRQERSGTDMSFLGQATLPIRRSPGSGSPASYDRTMAYTIYL
jgi:hypothetical protein